MKRRTAEFFKFMRIRARVAYGRHQKTVLSLLVFIIFASIGLVILAVYTSAPPGPSISTTSKGSGSDPTKKLESQPTHKNNPESSSPSVTSSPPAVTQPSLSPGSVLNLNNWKLTLPINTSHAGNPDEISQPELATFAMNPYFRLNDEKNGVVFQAPAGGATTSGSDYPRSELREMTNSGTQEANWSNTSGTHTMTIRQAITHLPTVKPQVVAGQIHDPKDYVILIRLEGSLLFVKADGKDIGTLDANYALGTVFTLQMVAEGSHIRVLYNGEQKVDYAKGGSGYYFKAGCYTQSSTSKGDSPDAYGEVIIYSLEVNHSS